MTIFIAPPSAPAYVRRALDTLQDEEDGWILTNPTPAVQQTQFKVYLKESTTPKVFEAHIFESQSNTPDEPLEPLPLFIATCGILGETTHDTFVAEVRRVLNNLSVIRSLDALLLVPSIPDMARFPQGSSMYVRHRTIGNDSSWSRGHVLRLGNTPCDLVLTEASVGPDEEAKLPPSNLYVGFRAPNESWTFSEWTHGDDPTKSLARSIPDFSSLGRPHGSFEFPYLPRTNVVVFTSSLKLPSLEALGSSTLEPLSAAQKSAIQRVWMHDYFDSVSENAQHMCFLLRFVPPPPHPAPPAALFREVLARLSMYVGAFASGVSATQREAVNLLVEPIVEASKTGGAKGKGKKGRR